MRVRERRWFLFKTFHGARRDLWPLCAGAARLLSGVPRGSWLQERGEIRNSHTYTLQAKPSPTLERRGVRALPGSFQRLTQMDLLWHLTVMNVPGAIH